MSKNILFTVVKNEAPFLLEWIAYHRQLGFDEVVVYSNNCTDGTDVFLDEMSRHGLVRHVPHDPMGRSPQGHGSSLVLDSGLLETGDHFVWLDPDEFLNIKIASRRLNDLIDYIRPYIGMPVPWRVFGDAGQARHVGRQICDTYIRASALEPKSSRLVKTFFKVTDDLEGVRIHAPSLSKDFWKQNKTILMSTGEAINLDLPCNKKWADGGPFHLDPSELSYDIAQINHYQVRSPAAFSLKFERGSGTVGESQQATSRERYNMAVYDSRNLNAAEDRSILFYEQATVQTITDFRAQGRVAEIQDEIWNSFREAESRALVELGLAGS